MKGLNSKKLNKKYFTLIPNYILDHLTHWDREAYTQIKKVAGENGAFWKSQKTSSKEYGISKNRWRKSLKILQENNLIVKVGTHPVDTPGGRQRVPEYKIADIWEMNINYYENKKGVSRDDTPLPESVKQGGIINEPKGVAPDEHKEELYKIRTKISALRRSKTIKAADDG